MGLEHSTENTEEIAHVLLTLRGLLNDNSDEIPEGRIIGGGKYKVRGNWFQGVISNLKFAADIILEDTALFGKVKEFSMQIFERRKAGLERMVKGGAVDSFVPTTREEIDAANALLREVIQRLENLAA